MLTIERLRLQLPHSIGGRGSEIAQLVAAELAARPLPGDLNRKLLTPAPLRIHPQATSREVAQAIVDAVHAELCKQTG